jgi:hypothetical protein
MMGDRCSWRGSWAERGGVTQLLPGGAFVIAEGAGEDDLEDGKKVASLTGLAFG